MKWETTLSFDCMTWGQNYEIWLEAHHICSYFHFRDIEFGYLGCILRSSIKLINCRVKNPPWSRQKTNLGSSFEDLSDCFKESESAMENLDKQISTLLGFDTSSGFLLRQKELDSLNIIEHRIHLETRTRQQVSTELQRWRRQWWQYQIPLWGNRRRCNIQRRRPQKNAQFNGRSCFCCQKKQVVFVATSLKTWKLGEISEFLQFFFALWICMV